MNKWLKGNGYWCPTCTGTGRGKAADMIEYEGGTYTQFYDPCETCNGHKRIAATGYQVIAGDVPQTPAPPWHSIYIELMEHGKLTPTGRLPRRT